MFKTERIEKADGAGPRVRVILAQTLIARSLHEYKYICT